MRDRDRCDKGARVRSLNSVSVPAIGAGGVAIASGAAVNSGIATVPEGTAFVISTLAVATILFPTPRGNIIVNVPIGISGIELPSGANGVPLITSTATSIAWLDDFREA